MNERRRGQSPDVEGSDEWTNSSDDSKYSDSDSSVPEWEVDVTEEGELVYIKYEEPPPPAPPVPASAPTGPASAPTGPASAPAAPLDAFRLRNDFKRSSTRRVSKGRIFKVLSNRYKQTKKTNVLGKGKKTEQLFDSPSSVPQDLNENCSEVIIKVDKTKFFYSDKGCQLEQMFGISVNKSEDGNSLTVSSFLPEAKSLYEAKVKRGSCLRKINGLDVTPTSINTVLERLRSDRLNYILTFTTQPLDSLSIEFKNLLASKTEHEFVLSQVLRDASVAVIYINCDVLDQNSSDDQGVIYCYPRPYTQNFLYNTRGAFVTLNHLTQTGLSLNAPLSSTILVNDVLINVVYVQRGEDLMLLALPNRSVNLSGARMATEDTVRLLEFLFGSLRRCFSERANVYKVDHLFSRLFAMLVCGFEGANSPLRVRLEELASGGGCGPRQCQFERVLPLAHAITLPRQVRLQIDDALAEFEAADYREWTDDPLNCQRLFIVTGCCIFYSGYLLSSHLPDEDLRDVHAFLRLSGLLQLSRLAPDQLLVWREVFVSAQRSQHLTDSTGDDYRIPDGRRFLLVVGKGNFLLASIMEAGGCTEEADAHPPPSPFYVEEAESCLQLLLDLALDKLLAGWLRANCRPQLQLQPHAARGEAGDPGKSATLMGSVPELHSILKRRPHSAERPQGAGGARHPAGPPSAPPQHDASYSEDSNSQKSYSEAGEERVAGRRAGRERRRDSSGSDSEWDGQAGSRTSGSVDMSEVRRGLLEEVSQLTAHRVTAGEENVLLHYVQLESARGVLLAPAGELEAGAGSALYTYILSAFRAAAHKIHALLQNTMRLKRILSPASCVSKSLVAVRERGVLLRAPARLLPPPPATTAAAHHYQFWVVGRLFSEPEPKEVYVCYHESVPQDVLEVAYRLSFLERLFSEPEPKEVYVCYHESVPQDVLEVAYRLSFLERLFSEPEPKEVYVCYHESVPQDVLEVAYRLSFLE